ncbi:MAG: hypothetical protein H0W61_15635 [Bacteroidetes bacterium]|nr:hypothetical protein [Bacteroidota bacterium]
MKTILLLLSLSFCTCALSQETTKSKNLKLKYTAPQGWTASEFGGKSPWEEGGNTLCKCSGVVFTKQNPNGKLQVLVYPSSTAGLDSAKRNSAGNLRFENVVKYDKIKNKFFSFERKRSSFTDTKTSKKTYEVIRYQTAIDDHFYIIYAWQEASGTISPDTEKALYEVVNNIEPN